MSCQYRTTPPPPNQLHPLLQPPTSAAVRIGFRRSWSKQRLISMYYKSNSRLPIASELMRCLKLSLHLY
ncbi:hypothetical protein L1987_00184 [Smallanthus sonchifolius]|uniref:Uncharacterized protein n=1 Tax=Smallanthus sonchifolius TaxID=185202 RepID=A0ACB9K1F9_9ASTR|nr:hypothetical protein L1987_00184 [Smallanthus sonchifolius]